MTRPARRLRRLLLILGLGLYVSLPLAAAAPTHAQPLPTRPRAERASRRGVLVLIIGGATVAVFVGLAFSGFFDQKK